MSAIESLTTMPEILRLKDVMTVTGFSCDCVRRNLSACVIMRSPGGHRYFSRDKLLSMMQGVSAVRAESNQKSGTPRHRNG